MSQVMRSAISFLVPVREFALHNATDEPITIMYDAETRVIPPAHIAIPPNERFPDVAHSAMDEDGDLIPGSLVIKDVMEQKELGEFGENRELWSAANAIKHSLGIDVSSGVASGPYALRGLSLLPPKPSKEVVSQIVSDGKVRHATWVVSKAQETISEYDQKNMARQRSGMGSIPPDAVQLKAKAVLDAYNGRLVSLAATQLGYSEPVAEDDDDDLLFLAFATEKAQVVARVAVASDPTRKPEEVVSELLGNKAAMALMREKFKMRKKPGV